MKTLAVTIPPGPHCGIRDHALFLCRELERHWRLVPVPLPATCSRTAWKRAAAVADSSDLALVHYEYGLFHSIRPYRNLYRCFMKRLRPPAMVLLHDLLPTLRPRWPDRPYTLRDALRDLAYLGFFPTWSAHLYALADHYLVHGPQLAGRLPADPGRATVSVHPHPLPPVRGQWRAGNTKNFTFISPGFVKPHKGYLDFLPILRGNPAWSWLIAGGPQDGTDQDFLCQLQARIRELGMEERVRCSGYLAREEMEQAMVQAEVAVFPYARATASGAAAWAMAMAMPVLTTDCTNFQALAAAGGGLFLLPRNDRTLWPDLVHGLLADRERQEELARANREFAATCSYRQLARNITARGEQLLAGQVPGRGEL